MKMVKKRLKRLKMLSNLGCQKREWNNVVVYAKANKLWFTINGKIASEVIDNEKAKRLDKALLVFNFTAEIRWSSPSKIYRLRNKIYEIIIYL